MEPGGPFFGFGSHANSTSVNISNNMTLTNSLNLLEASKPNTKSSTSSNPNSSSNSDNANQPATQSMLREQDQYMPIANVIRIMRRILPPHAKISDDAKETIQECVSEFISFITSEANQKCRHEQRKTVTADDVLRAMEKVGFDDYIEPLTVFLNRYRVSEGSRSARGERSNLGRGPAFGMAQQMAFYGSGFYVGLDSSDGLFDPISMGGLPRDGSQSGASGPSSAQNASGNLDPIAELR